MGSEHLPEEGAPAPHGQIFAGILLAAVVGTLGAGLLPRRPSTIWVNTASTMMSSMLVSANSAIAWPTNPRFIRLGFSVSDAGRSACCRTLMCARRAARRLLLTTLLARSTCNPEQTAKRSRRVSTPPGHALNRDSPPHPQKAANGSDPIGSGTGQSQPPCSPESILLPDQGFCVAVALAGDICDEKRSRWDRSEGCSQNSRTR
jgi:hypothetical protein